MIYVIIWLFIGFLTLGVINLYDDKELSVSSFFKLNGEISPAAFLVICVWPLAWVSYIIMTIGESKWFHKPFLKIK